jgi:hypothetical protein
VATIATTTSSAPFQYPANTLMTRNPNTGYLFALVEASTADTYDIYRSTNNGTSWASFSSTVRTNLVDTGSILIDNSGFLHWVYRTNESSQDRVYYREMNTSTGTWNTEVQTAVLSNGGSPGTSYTGVDIALINQAGTNSQLACLAVGTVAGSDYGISLLGIYTPYGSSTRYDNAVISGNRWFPTPGSGRITPSIDLEHNGDGTSAGTPNLWVAWGRTNLYLAKLPYTGSGWAGPSTGVTVATGLSAQNGISARWDGSRFLIVAPNPTTGATDTVYLFERDRANTTTTTRTTPSHPTGAIRNCAVSYNSISGDARVFAVGTSTAVLYYVDFIRATSSWSSWTQVLATAVLGAAADNWGVRRGSNGTNHHDVYTAHSGSPNTLVHTAQSLSYAPNTPTWVTPQTGAAADVGQALTLDWAFSDPDPTDTQSAYAVSRQIGAGSLAYWRASDSTWQAGEVQNTSSTSALTLASGWASGSDASYTFKVKVWDSASVASGYSTGLVVVPSVKVNPTITSPAVAAVLTTASVPVTWTVSEQTAYQLQLVPADVLDSFGRTSSSSWGSADTAESYTLVGTAANFGVGSGVGTITPGATSSDRLAVVSADTGADRTVETTVKWAALPASGVLRTGVAARYIDSSNFILGEISIATTGVVTVQATKIVAGTKTILATATQPTVYVGGVNWRVRCQVTGTRIQVKAWRAADSEPAYQIDTADSSITTGTLAGAWARNETAATTHVASFDTLSSYSLPAVYDSGWVSSTATTATPSTVLTTGTAWLVNLRTANNEGLASEWATVGVTVAFIAPATPTLAFGADPVRGWLTTTITNPTPGGGQPVVASQDLYRRVAGDTSNGVRVSAGLASGASYNDWQVVSGVAYEYRSLVYGVNGTTTYSAWTA